MKFLYNRLLFYPKLGQSLPKPQKISWYIDQPSLLPRLQTSYFFKLSNLPELIFHPHSYNRVRIVQNFPAENSPTENSSSSNFTAESSPSGFYEGSRFYSGFSIKKALVWESRCRDWKKRLFYKTCFHCRHVIIWQCNWLAWNDSYTIIDFHGRRVLGWKPNCQKNIT